MTRNYNESNIKRIRIKKEVQKIYIILAIYFRVLDDKIKRFALSIECRDMNR